MSYFFTVSGFLLFKDYHLKDYPAKMKRRFFSLLVPYAAWQTLTAIKLVIQGQWTFSLSNFLYQNFHFGVGPMDGPLWYMYAILGLAVISPVFLLLFKNKKIGLLGLMSLIVLDSVRARITVPLFVRIVNYGYINNILMYLPCWLIGAFYGMHADPRKDPYSLRYAVYILLLALLLDANMKGFFAGIAIAIVPIVSLALIPDIPSFNGRMGISYKYGGVYKLSFLMYAIHQPILFDILPYIYGIYARMPIAVSLFNLLTRGLLLLIIVGISAVIYGILKQFAPNILGVLTGGRTEKTT